VKKSTTNNEVKINQRVEGIKKDMIKAEARKAREKADERLLKANGYEIATNPKQKDKQKEILKILKYNLHMQGDKEKGSKGAKEKSTQPKSHINIVENQYKDGEKNFIKRNKLIFKEQSITKTTTASCAPSRNDQLRMSSSLQSMITPTGAFYRPETS
jgi:hypothetical protein